MVSGDVKADISCEKSISIIWFDCNAFLTISKRESTKLLIKKEASPKRGPNHELKSHVVNQFDYRLNFKKFNQWN